MGRLVLDDLPRGRPYIVEQRLELAPLQSGVGEQRRHPLRPPAMPPGAVALALRRAALAAMHAADPLALDCRLPARPPVAAVRGAARRLRRIAPWGAVRETAGAERSVVGHSENQLANSLCSLYVLAHRLSKEPPSCHMPSSPIARLRAICLALPEASEKEAWGDPTFRVRDRIFAMEKRGDGRVSLWCKAPEGSQQVLVGADPERFYVPPYVGHKGWIGMRLDRKPDWNEVAVVVRRSYRLIAPKKLAALVSE
jgi:predicted DNA-binding protein (MmcQ/YjbR family)